MILNESRCIFVHIPKTGGTSIAKALGHFDQVAYGVQDHRTIVELRHTTSKHDFERYYKFTIVRNPWDRVVSWYKNVTTDAIHRDRFRIQENCSLRDFLTEHGSIWGLQSQLHWIREPDGNIPLDFIGRFERLSEDFGHVCERLGLREVRLPHLFQAYDTTPYMALYDHQTRSIVAHRYAEEIEMFRYSFCP
jgi:hypothetical protein